MKEKCNEGSIEADRKVSNRVRCCSGFRASPSLVLGNGDDGDAALDQTLTSLQTDLSGPVAHALVVMSFVGSGVLYATSGGHSAGVSRLAAAGLGGSAALGAIQLMSYLFPYSPSLF